MSGPRPVAPEGEPAEATGSPTAALRELVLGAAPRWTRRDVAARAGVGLERAERIWRALGFPAVEDGERFFTDADVEALRAVARLIETGLVTSRNETMVVRAVGYHLSRLAEWQIEAFWGWLGRASGTAPGDGEPVERAAELMPELEALQRYVWRRHLAAYAERLQAGPRAADEEGASHAPAPGPGPARHPGDAGLRYRAVGFTDMVGYTRMTRGLEGAELGRVIDSFESLTGDVIAEGHGRVVKTIGDEVFFVCESASCAADIALELTARAHGAPELPRVRTGLAYGEVLSRFGDLYGTAVNAAARLTAVARPGTVLVDTAFSGELAGAAGYELRGLRPVSVRGFPRLRPVLLRPAPAGRRKAGR
ncbi:adenylate/guanylate cyclase domain-containing protein [Streptomyces sp. DH8]|uniref:adenylate/guanylate cyclase domain-containing protein n=1 Tax=Streptomyces sp. DH8 TaxID=2857008 RepID=UPI001E508813|nr:adenylate/guanylate cyclase domain-containing protein [Streptomyces sp. DH8]